MAALDHLHRYGLKAEAIAPGRLRVSPASLITDDLRRWISEHKPELLAELSAASRPAPRAQVWIATVNGKRVTIIDPDRLSEADFLRCLHDRFGTERVTDLSRK